ncbi:hypothetical protein ACO0K9_11545 [Undibacterium sp. Ji50W]|uniref:hypothetical protein n=1 Tax=Undibacterium sp. Ji50W TaxID=3413041 RepID=UPI003BF44280
MNNQSKKIKKSDGLNVGFNVGLYSHPSMLTRLDYFCLKTCLASINSFFRMAESNQRSTTEKLSVVPRRFDQMDKMPDSRAY